MKKHAIATIYDVAREAEVSPRTVSRFFNHPDKLAEGTRAHIGTVVQRLGFRPNIHANRMSRREHNTLAVMASFHHDGPMTDLHRLLLGYISRKVCALGKDLMVIGIDKRNEERVLRESFHQNKFDALMIVTLMPDYVLKEMADMPFPKVTLNWEPEIKMRNHISVGVHTYNSSYQLTEAIVKRGYRRIVYAEPLMSKLSKLTDRGQAAVDAASAHGKKLIPLQFATGGRIETARLLVDRILAMRPKPDCLYCFSDLIAFAVLHAFWERGVRVPKDMALVGFDGHEAGSVISPKITTMAQPWKQMAEVAVDVLVGNAPRGSARKKWIYLPTELVDGESW